METFKKNYYKFITIFGMILCLLWVIIINTKPYSDFAYYNELAKQIARGGSFGNTYTSVGYSIVLGAVYHVFGSNLMVAKCFNLILTFINYAIVYHLLKGIELDEKRLKIIYTLFVLFPNNIFYNSILGTEILFTTIFLLITLIYYSDIKYKYVIIGVFVAFNTMIKPFFIAFFLAIFLLELALKIRILLVVRHAATVLLVSVLLISPWIYRNTKLVGQFTTVSNNGGIVLYINNNSQNHLGRWMPATDVEASIVKKKEYISANMTEKNKMLSAAAKKWIVTHPLQFVELGFKRLANTYFVGDDISYSFYGTSLSDFQQKVLIIYTNVIRDIVFLPAIILILIFSINIIKSIYKKKEIVSFSLYSLICFYMFSSVYFITEGQGRYAFPFIFIIIYFVSGLITKAIRHLQKNNKSI